uniref:Uncharacterized protein n=1 Tax=Mesocestoides corti TaxID=53468 RepID=A0A5K3EXI3_MESCO
MFNESSVEGGRCMGKCGVRIDGHESTRFIACSTRHPAPVATLNTTTVHPAVMCECGYRPRRLIQCHKRGQLPPVSNSLLDSLTTPSDVRCLVCATTV